MGLYGLILGRVQKLVGFCDLIMGPFFPCKAELAHLPLLGLEKDLMAFTIVWGLGLAIHIPKGAYTGALIIHYFIANFKIFFFWIKSLTHC